MVRVDEALFTVRLCVPFDVSIQSPEGTFTRNAYCKFVSSVDLNDDLLNGLRTRTHVDIITESILSYRESFWKKFGSISEELENAPRYSVTLVPPQNVFHFNHGTCAYTRVRVSILPSTSCTVTVYKITAAASHCSDVRAFDRKRRD